MSVLLFLVKLTISDGAFHGLSVFDFLPVKEKFDRSGQLSFSLQDYGGDFIITYALPVPNRARALVVLGVLGVLNFFTHKKYSRIGKKIFSSASNLPLFRQ